MSDPRFNSPSRKSRFRSQPRQRPTDYGQEPGGPEDVPAEELHAGDEAHPQPGYEETQPQTGYEDVEGLYGHPAEPGEVPMDSPAYPREPSDDDQLPAGLRLTRSPDAPLSGGRTGVSTGIVVALSILGLAVGGVSGYLVGHSPQNRPASELTKNEPSGPKTPASTEVPAATLTAIDKAFAAIKQGQYVEARQQFEDLAKANPQWPSMGIEVARASLYQRDFQNAQKQLKAVNAERPQADASFLDALLHLTAQEFDAANISFNAAVALDPARADFFYFWGENLRREGKPQEAADKFRAAMLRNQYENVEGLYQLKYWLSLVQADQEAASGEGAKIDKELANERPTGSALFAGAARAIKAGQIKDAANYLAKARVITDPSVFRVIIQDPTFVQENYRPEIAQFYKG